MLSLAKRFYLWNILFSGGFIFSLGWIEIWEEIFFYSSSNTVLWVMFSFDIIFEGLTGVWTKVLKKKGLKTKCNRFVDWGGLGVVVCNPTWAQKPWQTFTSDEFAFDKPPKIHLDKHPSFTNKPPSPLPVFDQSAGQYGSDQFNNSANKHCF